MICINVKSSGPLNWPEIERWDLKGLKQIEGPETLEKDCKEVSCGTEDL